MLVCEVLTRDLDSIVREYGQLGSPVLKPQGRGQRPQGVTGRSGHWGAGRGAPCAAWAEGILTRGAGWVPHLSVITLATGPRKDQAYL